MKIKSLISYIFAFLLSISDISAQDLLPTSTTGQIIHHTYYTLSYSEANEQAEWVYYQLTPVLINGLASRADNFRPDPLVTTGSAQLSDYKGSGYDRGHLCPAADMKANSTAMSETFYLSNMSPQEPSFNRGIWAKLEADVRNWAMIENRIYIVTGGILTSNKGKIGIDGVTVPSYYYKVIYDPTEPQKMIALVLPNEGSQQPLQDFVVSVDYVESITGIDFFPELPDTLKDRLESRSDASAWTFTGYTSTSTTTSKSTSVQCKGIAKSTGVRCKNRTTNENGYCYLHQDEANGKVNTTTKPTTTVDNGRCQAITKAGTQCKRQAQSGSRYCWQHQR